MARGGRPFEGFCRCAEVQVIPRTKVSQPRIIVGGVYRLLCARVPASKGQTEGVRFQNS